MNEHLSCLHLWGIGNTAAMNRIFLETLISLLLGIYSEVTLPDHITILFLVFEEPSYRFLHHFTPPPLRTRATTSAHTPALAVICLLILAILLLWVG
jgi:hypothetical protein